MNGQRWRRAGSNREPVRFVKCMIAFRRTHHSLSRLRFCRDDVSWLGLAAPVDLAEGSLSFSLCLHVRSSETRT